MESFKNQYLSMIHQMQGNVFLRNMEIQFRNEKNRRELLSKRVSQLESQIDNLAQESLEMLKYSLKELGIEATNPPQFIEKAKDIVCKHNELQKKKINLESEVSELQQEQARLTKEKERQLCESLLLNKSSHNLTDHDIQQVVQNEINLCTKLDASTLSDKKHLDITLTKVEDERRCWRDMNETQDDNNNTNGVKYSLSKIDFDDSVETRSRQIHQSRGEEGRNQEESRAITEEVNNLPREDPRLRDSRNPNNMPHDLYHLAPLQPRFGEFNAAVMSHINSEIERNMRRGELPGQVAIPVTEPTMLLPQWPVSSAHVTNKSLPMMSSASRMAQVIEDSLRGPQEEIKKNVPKKTSKKSKESSNSNNLPMEGLASRFETCFSSQDTGIYPLVNDQGVRNNKRKRETEDGARRTETPGDNVSETSVKTEESGDSDQWQRKITSVGIMTATLSCFSLLN